MEKESLVELASVSTTWWVTINGVDYTAVACYDETTNYDIFQVYKGDNEVFDDEEIIEVKEAIEAYNDEAPTRE